MIRLAIILSLIALASVAASAQNTSPCQSITNSATVGQVVAANSTGTSPECKWIGPYGTIASTTSTLKGDGAGNAVAVSGTSSNCVLVNGTSAACDAPGQAAVANVTPVTVSANTTGAQVLQQLTLTAGLLNVAGNSGGVYTYNGSGIYTAAALQTPTLTWVLNACTVSGCGSGTVRAVATIVTQAVVTATNNTWNIRLHIANTATGSSGTLLAHGSAIVELTASSDVGTASSDSNTTSTSAIDLTGVVYLQLTVATSSGNAGNSITEDHSSLEPASAIGPTGPMGPMGTTVYPAAGVAVSTGSAWGTSITQAALPIITFASGNGRSTVLGATTLFTCSATTMCSVLVGANVECNAANMASGGSMTLTVSGSDSNGNTGTILTAAQSLTNGCGSNQPLVTPRPYSIGNGYTITYTIGSTASGGTPSIDYAVWSQLIGQQ